MGKKETKESEEEEEEEGGMQNPGNQFIFTFNLFKIKWILLSEIASCSNTNKEKGIKMK
jgi:hypothetical protein